MDDRIVEAVARAMFDAEPVGLGGAGPKEAPKWEDQPARIQEQYRRRTRAAITTYQAEAWQPKVKPLEWVNYDPECWYARCQVSGKEYSVIKEEGKWRAIWDLHVLALDTPEEGVARAQADFETRILSALLPPPPSPDRSET